MSDEPVVTNPPGPAMTSQEHEWLESSLHTLRRRAPAMSAHTVFSKRQLTLVAVVGLLVAACTVVSPVLTARLATAVATVAYALSLGYRLILVRRGIRGDNVVKVTDEQAKAIADDDLPVYTVLVPAYHEPEVIGKVMDAVSRLVYPPDRLDVRLLLEADDEETIEAARSVDSAVALTIVLVPASEPRTKPKACNYGLHSAVGDLVTIFDAEDRPEPLQLRRAVVALRRLGGAYACVQAQLGYFNGRQNVITRWFAVEYGTWFRFLLPGLVSVGAPIPLGGTSNHFRTDVLRAVGAWDAFNVTEDADLGIRLARLGFSVGVLESVTLEEANSDFVNWVKQRSRWYKGYLQTWLVHMREPRLVHRELGWRGGVGLHLFVAGTPVMALINPVFWMLSIMWFCRHPAFIHMVFPSWIFYIGFTCFVIGNAAVIYVNMLTTRVMGEPRLLASTLIVPLYWVMMSAAAAKAAFQLAWNPFYWEKTSHGLTTEVHADIEADAALEAKMPA